MSQFANNKIMSQFANNKIMSQFANNKIIQWSEDSLFCHLRQLKWSNMANEDPMQPLRVSNNYLSICYTTECTVI